MCKSVQEVLKLLNLFRAPYLLSCLILTVWFEERELVDPAHAVEPDIQELIGRRIYTL